MTRLRGPQPLSKQYFSVLTMIMKLGAKGLNHGPIQVKCLVAMTFYITHSSVN